MNNLCKLVAPALATVLLFGCGGGSSKPAGAGGAPGAAGGASGTFHPTNLACSIPGVPSTAACTDAELAPLQSCFFTNCGTALETCYGPAYMSGQFAGMCGAWAACTNNCACSDAACRTACGAIPSLCTSCLGTTIGACGLPCLGSVPTCTGLGGLGGASGGLGGSTGGLGGSSGAATCLLQLGTCCASAATTALQTACATDARDLVNMGDVAETACGVKLADLKSMYCP
jgi:hypothetical protein